MKAPFPYFGGKAIVAPLVWRAFGDVRSYVEPFAGSLAVLLARPAPFDGVETVNDADGLLSNFWRAMTRDPEGVIAAAEWPVNEADLHARHLWLVGQRARITERLMGDPAWCDPQAAGWWVWGLCSWIGSGWCSGRGPWTAVDGVMVRAGDGGQGVNRKLPHLGDEGRGVNRKRPHLSNAGLGVNRQIPHMSTAGQGVNRQRPHLGNEGRGVKRTRPHLGNEGRGVNRSLPADADAVTRQRYWLGSLVERLRYVRVACGDFERVLGRCVTHPNAPVAAVFLDPPYAAEGQCGAKLYSAGDGDVAARACAWALAHGDDPAYRIVLAGYEGEHAMPATWTPVSWEARGGYGKSAGHHENSARERLWLSPHCLPVED